MLREIFLGHNQIVHIDPHAFDVPLPHLNYVLISNNSLVSTELWLTNFRHRFCLVNLSHNQLERLTNERNATIDLSPDVIYGPGFVDLSYNQFVVPPWAQLGQYGITTNAFIGKFVNWGFDIRFNPLHCDCRVYDKVLFIKSVETVIKRLMYDMKCATPDKFSGLYLRDLPIEQLTCGVTKDCPNNCTCIQRPFTGDVLVDCAGRGLVELPEIMPKDKLSLVLSNNALSEIEPRDYFSRSYQVNLSHNTVDRVDAEVPRLLRNAVLFDLRENRLHVLPHTFQVMSPHAVYLDPDTLRCTCDLAWFPAWIQNSRSPPLSELFCDSEGRSVSLTNVARPDLGCTEPDDLLSTYKLWLISVAGLIVLGAVFLAVFRYEVLVFTHVLTHRFKDQQNTRYDVFLSSADDSETDNRWVCSTLLPALESRLLQCYWPCRDCLPGRVEIEEISKGLQESKSALVVLSPDYVTSKTCLFQFTQAYNQMIVQGRGRLTLVCLGRVSRCSVPEPRLRAMVTLRLYHANDRAGCLKTVLDKTGAACAGVTRQNTPAPD